MILLDMHFWVFIAWFSWNCMLAIIPVVLAFAIYWLVNYYRRHSGHKAFWLTLILILGIGWLIFLPNTGYLITGWRHFFFAIYREDLFTKWYATRDFLVLMRISVYAIFFICYSLFGLLTFALSIRPVAKLFNFRLAYSVQTAIPLFFLASFGVYLGLIPRLNSWDLFMRPGYVFQVAFANLQRPMLLLVIVIFALLLWLGYWFVDIWIDGFLARWRSSRVAHHAK